jgi:hypothetical protein
MHLKLRDVLFEPGYDSTSGRDIKAVAVFSAMPANQPSSRS